MELKEIILSGCIVGGFMGLTYSIKRGCKNYLLRQKQDDEKKLK